MPKRTRTKINPLRPLAGAFSAFNKACKRDPELGAMAVGAGGAVILVGAVLALVAGPISQAAENSQTQTDIMADIDQATQIELQDQFFQVASSHVITMESANTNYTFDFGTEFVHVDVPGDADLSYPFDDFHNPDLIRRAHEAGISLATGFDNTINDALSDEEKAWLAEEGERQQSVKDHWDKTQTDIAAFAENHSGPFDYNVAVIENSTITMPPLDNYGQLGPFLPLDDKTGNRPDVNSEHLDTSFVGPLPQPKVGG